MSEKLETMTVGQLIEELRAFDPDMPVVTSHSFYDHWGTIGADMIDEWSANEDGVTYSNYHRAFRIADDDDDDVIPVVVIGKVRS